MSVDISINCPVCNSTKTKHWAIATDIEYYTSDDEFNYRHCGTCETLFIEPMPLERLSEIYPDSYYSYTPNNTGLVYKVKAMLDRLMFRKLLKRIKSSEISALDIGGGYGEVLDVLKNCDSRFSYGEIVDLDPKAKELAEAKGYSFFLGSIEEYSTEKKFDVVLLLNLIEHVQSPHKVMKKIHNVLNPGGIVLIKTPNWNSLDQHIFRKRSWAGYHCPRHWVLFSDKSFRKLVSDVDMEIDSMAYTQGATFWAASFLNILKSFNMVIINKERPVYNHPIAPFLYVIFALFDFIRIPISKTSQMIFVLYKDR